MSLVAYGSSDESDNEEEETVTENQNAPVLTSNTKLESTNQDVAAQNDNKSEDLFAENRLFTKLPQPRSTSVTIEEEQDEFLLKKEVPVEKPKPPKPKVVIGIPSLSQFDSDDEDDVQKVAPKKPAVSIDLKMRSCSV